MNNQYDVIFENIVPASDAVEDWRNYEFRIVKRPPFIDLDGDGVPDK